MIIVFQIVVVIAALAIAVIGLNSRSSHSGRAWKKVALILFALGMIISVFSPDFLNNIAHRVGVGRGADLMLYVMIITFIFYVLNNYLHQQDQRDMTIRLGRKIAILEANERYKIDNRHKPSATM